MGDLSNGQILLYSGLFLVVVGFIVLIMSIVICEKNKKAYLENAYKGDE